MLINIFQTGLVRGSAHLPHDPEKAYAYVEHPTEGWRVYLRSALFLHAKNEPFRPTRFLVVKKTGMKGSTKAWEQPKGQMEKKEWTSPSLMECLLQNALRETEEEAHIEHVIHTRHTGLVLQSQESSYPENHFFQYHIFQGLVEQLELDNAFETFRWMKKHPAAVARWKRDRKEKDALAWYDPRHTRLMGRWSPTIAAMYIHHMSNH